MVNLQNIRVLDLDNHILVVFKEAGVPVQEDDTGDADLLNAAKAFIKTKFDKPGNVFLGLVHRLDRPVSGPVVFARTSKAARRLADQFRQGQIEKKYVALVEGRLLGEGTCEDYLVQRGRTIKIVGSGTRGAKRAVLRWRSKAVFGDRTVVDVTLETGRKHQIRCQLASLGHSICGDLRYRAKGPFDGRNIALHCYALGFTHPVKQTRCLYLAQPAWKVDPGILDIISSLSDDVRKRRL